MEQNFIMNESNGSAIKHDQTSVHNPPTPERNEDAVQTNIIETANAPKKPTTLADLIRVCREKGFQVFNDRSNVPESEKRWIEEHPNTNEGHTSVYGRSLRDLRSSSQRSERTSKTRSGRSRYSKQDSRRSKRSGGHAPSSKDGRVHIDFDSESPGQGKSRLNTHSSETRLAQRKASAATRYDTLTVSSDYRRSSATTRNSRSSTRSILELFDDNADIDAEDVLRLRMRRKCKRHKENKMTDLVAVLQQKQIEIEAASRNLPLITDTKEQNMSADLNLGNNKDTDGVNKKDIESQSADERNMGDNKSPPIVETNEIKANKTCANVNDIIPTNSQVTSSKKQDADDLPLHTSTPITTVGSNTNDECQEGSPGGNMENDKSHHPVESNAIPDEKSVKAKIEEMRITEGDMTLVLYGVTARPVSGKGLSGPTSNETNPNVQSASLPEYGIETHKNYDQSSCNNELGIRGHSVLSASEKNAITDEQSRLIENVNGTSSPGITDNTMYCKQTIDQEIERKAGNISSTPNSMEREQHGDNSESTFLQSPDGNPINFENHKNFERKSSESNTESHSNLTRSNSKRLFNKSDEDFKSDKGFVVNCMEPKSSIHENVEFQGDLKSLVAENIHSATYAAATNGRERIETFDVSNRSQVGQDKIRDCSVKSETTLGNSDKGIENDCSESPSKTMMDIHVTAQPDISNNVDVRKITESKRSYGNGFLVSGTTSTIIGSPQTSEENQSVNDNDVSTVDSNVDTSRVDNEGVDLAGTENKINARRKSKHSRHTIASSSSKSENSSTSPRANTPFKRIHGAAKLMLLMAQLKHSYEEEQNSQQSFLQEVGETRRKLKDTYVELQSKIEPSPANHDNKSDVDSSVRASESEMSIPLPVADTNEKKMDQLLKSQTTSSKSNNISEKSNPDNEESREDNSVTNNIHDVEEVSDDANGEMNENEDTFETDHNTSSSSHSSQRKTTKPKVDTHWDHNGPVYKQVKSGFKSEYKIPDSSRVMIELKKLRQLKFATGNIPASNVYIEDATQRYNQSQYNHKHGNESIKSYTKTVSNPSLDKERSVIYDEKMAALHPYTDGKNLQVESNERGKRLSPVKKTHSKHTVSDPDTDRLNNDKRALDSYKQFMNTNNDLPKTFETKSRKRERNSYNTQTTRCKLCKVKPRSHLSGSPRNKVYPIKLLEEHHSEHSETMKDVNDNDCNGTDCRCHTDTVELQHNSSHMSSPTSRRSEVSIGKAVEIVQSRNKFYKSNLDSKSQEHGIENIRSPSYKENNGCEYDQDMNIRKSSPQFENRIMARVYTMTREARVLRLYDELRRLKYHRQMAVQHSSSDIPQSLKSELDQKRETNMRKFLLMDYGLSNNVQSYRSNIELDKFLHEAIEYDICTRVKTLYRHPSRREKALENLRQKFYNSASNVSYHFR